jgi:hypothetical protein
VLLEQPLDRPQLEDAFWLRRGDDAAPLVAILLEHPLLLGRQAVRLVLGVHRADEFGGVLERRILGVDLDHRQQSGERPLERHQVAELLLDHVADHPFGLRTEHVQRIGLDLGVGRTLQRQQAHLRPIAVADHEVVVLGHRRQRLGCDLHVAALVLGGHRLAAPQQGVAAQSGDNQHLNLPTWPPGSP